MEILEKNKIWALMSVEEAERVQYGCERCLDVIAKARKTNRRVLGYQTALIEPKWEIVAIWGD